MLQNLTGISKFGGHYPKKLSPTSIQQVESDNFPFKFTPKQLESISLVVHSSALCDQYGFAFLKSLWKQHLTLKSDIPYFMQFEAFSHQCHIWAEKLRISDFPEPFKLYVLHLVDKLEWYKDLYHKLFLDCMKEQPTSTFFVSGKMKIRKMIKQQESEGIENKEIVGDQYLSELCSMLMFENSILTCVVPDFKR